MITVVGSLNLDLVIETSHLPSAGETVLGSNVRRACGGKGANQAVAVARMGSACAMIGAVGHDSFGDEMLAKLRDAGVNVAAVVRRSNVASGAALIVVDSLGQNQIAVASGANETLTPDEIRANAELITNSRAVVVQLETPVSAVEAVLRLARHGNAITVLNPAPFVAGCDALLPFCDWVIPNEHEATCLGGVAVNSPETARHAARSIRDRFGGVNVMVTLGPVGAWLECFSFSGHISAFAMDAVDSVGAGDTFIGAFVSRLTDGAPPSDAARFGCAAAALAVTRRGAQASIPTRSEVEELLQRRAAPPDSPD